ncbi:MAG TPA: DUF3570 domain-containing protein [Polyangia bacterium]
MRRPFCAAVSPRLAAGLFAAAVAVAPAGGRADDSVTVRGVYYREASTRVIQPMMEVRRDSDSGLDVDAHFLVDAITSASMAAGTAVDNIFTEIRDEVGFRVRRRWERSDLSLAYKYSAESDYWSHSIGASYGSRLWDDTAALRVSVGRSFDTMQAKGPNPPDCHQGPGQTSCWLNTWYAGVSFSQVLSPVMLAQVSYEAAYLDGYQGNLYRPVPTLNNQIEFLPPHRLRNAITPRIAYYIPATSTGLQLHYRYYFDFYPGERATDSDPWLLMGHMIEARVYQQLTPTLEMRLLFRYYRQNHANFWCAPPNKPTTLPPTEFCAMNTSPPSGYATGAVYFTADPKLGPLHTEYPEVQLVWEADALREVPFLRWFAAGSFEISYGYYFQNTSFGNAHVLQTGYRLPY